jgi:putative RNA 2'-phosphotransferase
MNHNNFNKISKVISHALRHEPEKYGLTLDEKRFVPIDLLVESLRKHESGLEAITRDDIIQVITSSDKKRHEIVHNNIRALYGHSCISIIEQIAVSPPNRLFHGTSRKYLNSILQNGLQPMSRKQVHLSTNISTAISVGKRKDNTPIVLQIDAKNAFISGINFYKGNDDVWLADKIPPLFIDPLQDFLQ